MKKYFGLIACLLLSLFVFTGCEKVENSNYKEGTYFGAYEDNYGGSKSMATAVVYVDQNGMIKSVFLDTVYSKDSVLTTKKTLGDDYNMKPASEAKKEWYEQVNLIETKVIENQDISFIKLNEDGKTDTIAGVTMKVNALYEALNNALTKAKK